MDLDPLSPSESSSDAVPPALAALSSAQRERLTEILDQYLASLESGVPVSPDALVAAHPDLAEPLKNYLQCLGELHDVAAGFTPPPPLEENALEPTKEAHAEKRLGDFVLLKEIGHGGMGVVYEALQISLGRRVALKVLPFAAVLDSRQIARFKNEAQAAAQLHHPHIVPVYAVGEERNVHFYAMQLIEGQPLDLAIESMRSTKVGRSTTITDASSWVCRPTSRQEYDRSIAGLGIQAAEALHAAHSYGIVHRDIKPSNLLIDHEGKLWVTDFGLARVQTDAALTRTGDVVGTQRYMSPEQALGQAALVDHRTDIYSLGVTLYELLTLHAPFGDNTAYAIDYSRGPTPLKHWEPQISRDLETIILKALSTSREDRYLTAQELAEDLRRLLDGMPILAQRPGVVDRLGKWSRRHRRLVVASSALAAAALIGLAVGNVLISQERARSEQNFQRAERHFRDAQSVVDRFGSRLAERLKDVAGADEIRRELLEDTLRYYENFVQEAAPDPALRTELALTQSKIGQLAEQIGTSEEAIAAQRKALALFEELLVDQPDSPELLRRASAVQNNLALALQRIGLTLESRQAFEQAIARQQQLVALTPSDASLQQDLALSHNNLGLLLAETGNTEAAEKSFDKAIAIQKSVIEKEPGNADCLRMLAASLNNLAALSKYQQDEEKLALYEQASQYLLRASLSRPQESQIKSDLALAFNNLGSIQSRMGALDLAVHAFERAIEIQELLVQIAPLQRTYRRDLAVSFNNLGLVQSKLKRPADSEQSFAKALALQEVLVAQNPQDVELASSLGGIFNNRGIVLEELNRPREAAECYCQAIERQKLALAQAKGIERYRTFLAKHYYNYGRTLRKLGHGEEAAAAALERSRLEPHDAQRQFSVAEELALANQILVKQQRLQTAGVIGNQAIEHLRRAKDLGMKLPENLQGHQSFAGLANDPAFLALADNGTQDLLPRSN